MHLDIFPEPVHGGGTVGKKGRWGKTDPRRAEAEGLTTLTSILSGNLPSKVSCGSQSYNTESSAVVYVAL